MTKQLNVLVADDDTDNASSLGELFELEGHRARVVHSGQAAIDACLVEEFDFAFLDVMMPGKNGVESFFEIRSLRPAARVFMMTGYSVEELLRQAVAGGALGVLEKPYDAAEVLSLTRHAGPSGLVVSSPARGGGAVGSTIQTCLISAGLSVRLVKAIKDIEMQVARDDVVVLEADVPLIEEVSAFATLKRHGHQAPTIIVPPAVTAAPEGRGFLGDARITGVLNKPFDPESLLQLLHGMAA